MSTEFSEMIDVDVSKISPKDGVLVQGDTIPESGTYTITSETDGTPISLDGGRITMSFTDKTVPNKDNLDLGGISIVDRDGGVFKIDAWSFPNHWESDTCQSYNIECKLWVAPEVKVKNVKGFYTILK